MVMAKFNVIACYSEPDKWPGIALKKKEELLKEAFTHTCKKIPEYTRGVGETSFYGEVKRYLQGKDVKVFLVLGLEASSEEHAKRVAKSLAFHAFGDGNYLVEVVPSFSKIMDDPKTESKRRYETPDEWLDAIIKGEYKP